MNESWTTIDPLYLILVCVLAAAIGLMVGGWLIDRKLNRMERDWEKYNGR